MKEYFCSQMCSLLHPVFNPLMKGMVCWVLSTCYSFVTLFINERYCDTYEWQGCCFLLSGIIIAWIGFVYGWKLALKV